MHYNKEFLQQRLTLESNDTAYIPPDLPRAAVLIPIITAQDQTTLLFTKRTDQLTYHAGQICFPGGRKEISDANLMVTALRETEEELGIPAVNIEIIGRLEPEPSSSGFLVTSFIGIVSQPFQLQPDSYEVAEVFEIPLVYFLQPQHYYTKTVIVKGIPKKIYFIEYGNRMVWGLTAKILFQLMEKLTAK